MARARAKLGTVLTSNDSRGGAAAGARSKRGRATEAKILKVAAKMFASRGYGAVTTREVAFKSGIMVPSMYRYFGSKRDLYLSACSAVLAQFAARYNAELDRVAQPMPKLRSFVSLFYFDLIKDPCFGRLLQREIIDSDEKGLTLLTKRHFTSHFSKVVDLCRELIGEKGSERRAFSIYASTFGNVMLAAIGKAAKVEDTHWDDPVAMGRLILSECLPGLDWSDV